MIRRRARGFSSLELAVCLTVMGVVAVAMSQAFSGAGEQARRARALADAEVAREALRTFALRELRLPCPDTSAAGDAGLEGGGGACPDDVQVGWLPYLALDLPLPEPAARLRYGVRRDGSSDLVAPTPTAFDGPGAGRLGGLRAALGEAGTAAAGVGHPYFGADDGTAGATACGGPAVANPAFVLVAPVDDRDASTDAPAGFDGPNRAFARGAGLCTAPPSRAPDAGYDDVVVAEGATTLLGFIAASTR
ncbi:type II secretion system protein [Coralloluteibacterium stylophorae]|uniref:Prepilin-type N-terminal cleavage/methylation domain-containing protein n=1 Tax=Coralloluteibacterium stylophorae TaxID=1776034 RepID=A0A8J8AXN4_9GAMM|nr:prepilin-type N-terminal cleavage/methylation domain-containing protein [Coralloluteibacterium stylophorae]MBS7456795.1 hypothetical protein [Coralloluteibacterium stylophorae]